MRRGSRLFLGCARAALGLALALGLTIGATHPAGAEPAAKAVAVVDDEYRTLMRELLELTGALELGTQMANGVIQSMLASLEQTGEPVPAEVATIIRETSNEFFGQIFDQKEFLQVQSEIYARYFTKDEMRELLAFYRTPLGKKTISALPGILQEGMQFGQRKATEVMPAFQAELRRRLEAVQKTAP